MTYRLGVDVGGTFTDLLLINEATGDTHTAKVPSTPEDSSIGVLNGINRICEESKVDPKQVDLVMHGTTVATNAVLTGKGATVGLVTTAGYKHVLQVARSFCPGGLGGWVSFIKKPLLAPLELTIEANERMGADGNIVTDLDEKELRASLQKLKAKGAIEALTICFVNSYLNDANEVAAQKVAQEVFGDIPVSISSDIIPEMQEYERTETTVVNAYVLPEVSLYVNNLQQAIAEKMGDDTQLSILRSDGGLASARAASESPVNLLMSGPAGGVAGAMYFCGKAGYKDILTFDMGGTSTDVALIQDSKAKVRRETMVGDVRVRAPSVDVRTVGAGGGSIAFVPELTKALAVMRKNDGKEYADWNKADQATFDAADGKAEYNKCVEISTQASIREMILPGLVAVISPVIVGFGGGAEMLGGLLAGVTVCGVLMAIFQSNAGGAWDNAKKMFEEGVTIQGQKFYKGSDPHKAAVVGDTVGDPFKDTSGPSLNILLKLMSVVALVIAPFL